MNRSCPDEARLTRYVDRDLSPEEDRALSEHVQGCAWCRERVERLRALLDALRPASLSAEELGRHVSDVMARLDAAPAAAISGGGSRAAWFALAAAAASIGLWFGVVQLRPHTTWQARGGQSAPTIARDVGVQAYAFEGGAARPLTPGAAISRSTALGAGFRNLGVADAYLLLFAVDARGVVHWIAPRYASADSDPEAVRLALTADETWLPDRVVFEDVAPGALRIVSVVTPALAHVSEIEALEAVGASSQAIMQRLQHAEVRELRVIVKGEQP